MSRLPQQTGAHALRIRTPRVEWLPGGRGHGANWLRKAGQDKRIRACIFNHKLRTEPAKDEKCRHERRNRIEVTFGSSKDWRRVVPRYDNCPKAFLSATPAAAIVM